MTAEGRPAAAESVRLFVALTPEVALKERFGDAGRALHAVCGGRRQRPETLHLTLVFIGALARRRLPALISSLGEVRAAAFRLLFDRAECWRRNRIAALIPSRPPRELFTLVGMIEQTLDAQSVPFDRRPYAPHFTLLRRADCTRLRGQPGQAGWEPIAWSVREFELVESVLGPAGAEHRRLASFALGDSEDGVAQQVPG